MLARTILAGLLLFGAAVAGTTATDFQGRVVGVQDGDTITVFKPGQPAAKVRLVEIDAPESGQPYGRKSKQALSGLVFGRNVQVESEGEDRYGRTLGRVYVGRTYVNAEMVRRGAAWVYRDYSRDRSFPPLEAAARRERAGLWGLQADQIVAPWEWRRGRRSGSPTGSASARRRSGGGLGSVCTAKTRCAQMTSCSEARLHLQQCGATRLDGDGDGIPCEAICR